MMTGTQRAAELRTAKNLAAAMTTDTLAARLVSIADAASWNRSERYAIQHEAARRLDQLHDVAVAVADALATWATDSGASLTCDEANTLAALVRLARGDHAAAAFLAAHAVEDDEGDDPEHVALLDA